MPNLMVQVIGDVCVDLTIPVTWQNKQKSKARKRPLSRRLLDLGWSPSVKKCFAVLQAALGRLLSYIEVDIVRNLQPNCIVFALFIFVTMQLRYRTTKYGTFAEVRVPCSLQCPTKLTVIPISHHFSYKTIPSLIAPVKTHECIQSTTNLKSQPISTLFP